MDGIKKYKKRISAALIFILIPALIAGITACSLFTARVQADDLMDGISPQDVETETVDRHFIENAAGFYIKLFKETVDMGKNSLISPLSVILALAMTANGANGETLAQMEEVIGGDISLDGMNEYLYSYVAGLYSEKKSRLGIANSIWFRDDEDRLMVEEAFLQKNADYYGASAYKSAFDDQTLKDINNWVSNKTDGMIDRILDVIHEDAVMYLINAVVFDAEWKTVYKKNDIHDGKFKAFDGTIQDAEFMNSMEGLYIDDGNAIGFIKPYAGGGYSFVALLPDESMAIGEYIAGLTGQKILDMIDNAQDELVTAVMPKFSYEYEVSMNDALKSMGMPSAFSANEADFSRLGRSSRGNIYIGEVLHKTYISVDELGTKAGAVTKVEMVDESYVETKTVRLDRPFIYCIIENKTGLPVFIGTVMTLVN